jgi:uncharacterized protein (TIGR00290 family)
MHHVFASWSGGKDCCLACYRAKGNGFNVRYLANTVTENGRRSCSHGLSADIIKVQSQAMGIPVVQRRTTRDTYEDEFTNMLRDFRGEGIEGGVFGDIDFNAHREWIERVCGAAGITPHLPLWLESQDKLIREFIDSGFESIVIATKADMLGEEWLGRKIDYDFIGELDELSKTKNITPCGEAGEYHTLVIDGPLFQKRIEITEAEKVFRDEHWFLEIKGTELKDKQ